jgi:hypothetical protein
MGAAGCADEPADRGTRVAAAGPAEGTREDFPVREDSSRRINAMTGTLVYRRHGAVPPNEFPAHTGAGSRRAVTTFPRIA